MTAKEIFKKVRKIEIKTRGLSNQIFSGEYLRVFKGRGMAFSEVREYQYGDDIRSIDWNVTARFNRPYIKVFEEERELTVMILVDISGSGNFGTETAYKREIITEISALLAFSAIQNNDKIGVILFSDRVEKFIPPQKGKKHILRIIKELLEFSPQSSKTALDEPLKFLTNAIKKRCTAFLISDFITADFEKSLRIASNKHDMVALRIYDRAEKEIPDLGLIKARDPESNIEKWIDSSSPTIRKQYSMWWDSLTKEYDGLFKKCGVDSASIMTGEDYVLPLMRLFKKR